MSGQDIADLVTGELDKINWSAPTATHRMLSMQAVSTGIQKYINDNWSITAMTVGILTNPPPALPVRYSEKVTLNMMVGMSPVLMGMLMSMTMMAQNLLPIFSALSAWLSAPPWIVTITGGTVLTPVTGIGTATFPAMTAMGATCLAQMSGVKPDNRDSAWSIMGTHIYNGLAANLIPPIPTVGTLGPGAFVGVTTAVMTF
jgi:hypothetical protein